MERLQGNPSVLGWNDSRGVIQSWDGTTPGDLFCHGMERLHWSQSWWKDSRGVIPGGTTPGESFCPAMERLQGRHYVLGWNDSRGVILSWDRTTPGESFSTCETTPGESFCPGIERPQKRHSVLGWNASRGVILSWDRTTPAEFF